MSKTIITTELIAETRHPDGYHFRATVETSAADLCRLNVSRHREDEDEAEAGQGMDITAAECKALAQMLLGVAAILDADASFN